MATAIMSKMMPLATPSAPGEKCSSLVRKPPRTSKTTATVAAVVNILRRTRRLVASGMSAVASRKGTSAILGPIPIRSSRKVSMTKAASSDSSSFITLRPACLEIRASTSGGLDNSDCVGHTRDASQLSIEPTNLTQPAAAAR
jgi:hypothetical protein